MYICGNKLYNLFRNTLQRYIYYLIISNNIR
nr:MAG TPA: hypothetical protein [Caudoviricetes sp.]